MQYQYWYNSCVCTIIILKEREFMSNLNHHLVIAWYTSKIIGNYSWHVPFSYPINFLFVWNWSFLSLVFKIMYLEKNYVVPGYLRQSELLLSDNYKHFKSNCQFKFQLLMYCTNKFWYFPSWLLDIIHLSPSLACQ